MSRTSQSEWAKRVERWRGSGLTANEFAAETGVKASTLSYWSWRLGASQRKGRSGRSSAAGPRFVELSPPPVNAEPLMLELLPGASGS